jgi:hypothetical protein
MSFLQSTNQPWENIQYTNTLVNKTKILQRSAFDFDFQKF